jgi:two-component system response regulator AlgR
LRLLLEERLESSVVGEAADSQELLDQVEDAHPDIILLDWDLPGASTAELIAVFSRLDGQPKVVVLSTHPELAQSALAVGADAFVAKCDPPKRLLTAIRALSVEG